MKKLLSVLVLSSAMLMAFDSQSDGVADGSDGSPSPVPEPATIGLMGAGVAAIGFAAWRKNRKR
ncbi:MAG: PEP-CTERM sorting domain-containing protein [Acidobacteria bacterium]|nr:PEP-CTERM sorting domain-containing protein [Acidobacteriota bacterium]